MGQLLLCGTAAREDEEEPGPSPEWLGRSVGGSTDGLEQVVVVEDDSEYNSEGGEPPAGWRLWLGSVKRRLGWSKEGGPAGGKGHRRWNSCPEYMQSGAPVYGPGEEEPPVESGFEGHTLRHVSFLDVSPVGSPVGRGGVLSFLEEIREEGGQLSCWEDEPAAPGRPADASCVPRDSGYISDGELPDIGALDVRSRALSA